MLRVIEALFVCLKQQLKLGPNLSDMYNLCLLLHHFYLYELALLLFCGYLCIIKYYIIYVIKFKENFMINTK